MKDLLHSRFIQTVLSADMSTEPTEAMEYYQEFYMAATSTIWAYLSVSYGYFTNYFVHHYLDPCPPQSGFARGYKKSSLSELSCFLRSLAEREGS